MENFVGLCHCGKVEFTFSLPDKVTRGVRCNCSIYLFYDSEVQGRVNLGCVESLDTFAIEAAFCDGASF